jgi:hypothetical protein
VWLRHNNGAISECRRRTLHKIYTFVEAQQDGNKIKRFFRHSEMTALLKDCKSGLDRALEVFKV